MSLWPRIASAALAVATLVSARPSRADESPYCKKVRSRAVADAALLFAPTAHLQGVKFPANGQIDTGINVGAGYQVRGALSWSPLDFYKGFRVMSVGDADCERHTAVVTVQELMAAAPDYGRLPALRKEATLLEARRSAWEAVVAKANERFAARTASLLDVEEIRSRASELERRRLQVKGEVERLSAKNLDERRLMLGELASSVEATTMKFEKEAAHVRSLDAWDVRVTGGVVPNTSPVDYYGMVQISFNLGSFTRNAYDTRYLDARQEELRKARYEVREQLRVFREQIKAAREQAKQELAIVEEREKTISTARDSLVKSDAPNAPHAVAIVELGAIFVEVDRAYLTAFIEELGRLEDK